MGAFGAEAGGALTITEGGAKVWCLGTFVAGVDGVTGATAGSDASGAHVAIEVGSGAFAFAVFSKAPARG